MLKHLSTSYKHIFVISFNPRSLYIAFFVLCSKQSTVFIRIVAAATINFAPSSVRLLIEGGYYLFRARAMIDTAARMRYVYIRTYAGNAHPMNFIARAATIRGRLLFNVRLLFE